MLFREPTVWCKRGKVEVLEDGLGVLHLNNQDARKPPLKGGVIRSHLLRQSAVKRLQSRVVTRCKTRLYDLDSDHRDFLFCNIELI